MQIISADAPFHCTWEHFPLFVCRIRNVHQYSFSCRLTPPPPRTGFVYNAAVQIYIQSGHYWKGRHMLTPLYLSLLYGVHRHQGWRSVGRNHSLSGWQPRQANLQCSPGGHPRHLPQKPRTMTIEFKLTKPKLKIKWFRHCTLCNFVCFLFE